MHEMHMRMMRDPVIRERMMRDTAMHRMMMEMMRDMPAEHQREMERLMRDHTAEMRPGDSPRIPIVKDAAPRSERPASRRATKQSPRPATKQSPRPATKQPTRQPTKADTKAKTKTKAADPHAAHRPPR